MIFDLSCFIVFITILFFIFGLLLYPISPNGDIFYFFKGAYKIFQGIKWFIDENGFSVFILAVIGIIIFLKTSLWVVGRR